MIRALTPEDLDAATTVLRAAFAQDPALAWLLPDERTRTEVEPALAQAMCRYAMQRGIAWCTDDVSGIALRRPPGREHLEIGGLLAAGYAWLPFQMGIAATARLLEVDAVTERLHREAVEGPHWYLWSLAVDPGRQGEGLGGALMARTFAEADAAGLPCYLETTHPRARAIHEAHGFEVVGEADLGGLTIWAMVRRPLAVAQAA